LYEKYRINYEKWIDKSERLRYNNKTNVRFINESSKSMAVLRMNEIGNVWENVKIK